MEKQIVYVAMYNPMIHESSFGIISIHLTPKGAEMAMEFHRHEAYKIWLEETDEEHQKEYPFGKFEAWQVMTFEVFN
jgi:hypothetical protein